MFLIILIALLTLVFSVVIALLMQSRTKARQRKTLEIITGQKSESGAVSASSASLMPQDKDKKRSDIAKKLKEQGDQRSADKSKPTLKNKIAQAGLGWSLKGYLLFSAALAVSVMGVLSFLGLPQFIVLLGGFTGATGLPKLFLSWKAKKRQKAFLADFPDALEAMQRLLKAGMPVSEAIAMVAREFTGPVSEEMERIFEAQKIGVSMPEATMEAADRMPLTEMRMFATGIAIQTQTGASLSEVLNNLSNVIRARHRLKRKVTALSSEAKSSAMIIGALPCLVALAMYFVNRPYFEMLLYHPVGQLLLGGAVAWMCIGVLVMNQMINFKV